MEHPSSAKIRRWSIIVVPTIAFLVLGWAWAFASPTGASADESFHVTSAYCAWGDSELCTHSDIPGVVEVPDRIANASCMAQLGNEDASCVYALTNEIVQTIEVNGGDKYPPVYYWVMRAFAGPDVDRSVLLMRLFNVSLAAGLLAFALAVARPVARRAVALAWMACLVPMGIYFIASVNPSGWAIAGGALFWVFLYTMLTEPHFKDRRAIAAATGATACIAISMSARADSAFVLILSAIAVGLLAWPHLRGRLKRLWLLVLAIPLVVGAALFNVGRYVQLDLQFPPGNPDMDQPNAVVKMLVELPTFLAGIVGGQVSVWAQRSSSNDSQIPGFSWPGYAFGVGSLDVQNPEISSLLVLACVAGVIFLGLRSYGPRKLVALLLLTGALVVQLVLIRGLAAFQPVSSLQPRYFFATVVVIVSIAAVTFPRSRSPINRGQAALLIIALTIADTAALMATVARYTYGQAHSWTGIADPPGWWWSYGPSPLVIIVIGSLAACAWLVAMARVVLDTHPLVLSEPRKEVNKPRLDGAGVEAGRGE